MITGRPRPDLETFRLLALPGSVVPICLEFPFDTETPVTAYAKLRRGAFGFLLESVIGGERWARYSFVGSEPREAWRLVDDRVERWTATLGWRDAGRTSDPLADFGAWVGRHRPVAWPGLPRFWGGAVGFFGYDLVRWFERLPSPPPRDVPCPDACFLLTDHVLIVDNLLGRALAVTGVPIPEGGVALDGLYRSEVERLREWLGRLAEPVALGSLSLEPGEAAPLRSNRTAADFQEAVRRVIEYIRAGDAFQVVLSQRKEARFQGPVLDVYRALRTLNPSPYLYLLELDGVRLVGSSPEVLVRVEDRDITLRPIAGTRRRGATAAEDETLVAELLADEKERAEHLMLVDLGRNDVARVAEPGTVRLVDFMVVEKYSHVIHLVSEVTGRLRDGLGTLDAFRAAFPAGTLSGAPKVRAMEIIDELEPTRRGPYGGAAGYVGFGTECMDMAIAIRTIVGVGERAFAQAGAGIVYDSVPEREWEETESKARALVRALAMAAAAEDASAAGVRDASAGARDGSGARE